MTMILVFSYTLLHDPRDAEAKGKQRNRPSSVGEIPPNNPKTERILNVVAAKRT